MKKLKNFISILTELNKTRITFVVTLTTLAGYVLANKHIDSNVILPMVGIFILACGSAALNHYQDRDKDALMERTKDRPLPSGRISERNVLLISAIEILAGTWIIYIGSNLEAAILGFMAFIWYNGIYTPLKRVTAFAVIPGSVIGAIPPAVGWVAGGGALLDIRLVVLTVFFFISQVPHFWLLMLKYGKEYEVAGFPSITSVMTPVQIKRAIFIWTVSTAIIGALIVLSGLVITTFFKIMVFAAAAWLIALFSRLLRKAYFDFNPFRYFMSINYFVLVLIIAMIVDPLM
ncbi:protoheme IX farnesyltransferase [Prolixibacter denitrificans]|uniref:Protoheme IX farnesyltransferase n=1 Tax=Prolixibacter denitrificans TaxID=1541063 RepID=A0A2P8C869_9BACT|nr:protoheme IX farnesyltransferase [Prolixibacter denitrificans]PSK81142.1 protoheme IX farnesyltransferase [Prolixibacter denitrificans]GET22258.1 protoheme IX farnesyltransferase [Prolixibacter denitrificans]